MQMPYQYRQTVLFTCFSWYDVAVTFLARHYVLVKRSILVLAHLLLLGFFVPALIPFQREYGSFAADLLTAILFLSPLSVIVRMRLLSLLMGLRRELGIMIGYAALVHGIGFLRDPMFARFYLVGHSGWQVVTLDKSILAGILGLIGMTLLLGTSNTLSMKVLGGKYWKKLHRLVYPVFVVVTIHRFFLIGSSWQHLMPFIETGALLASYTVLKYIAWKRTNPRWLQKSIDSIARYYQSYQKRGAKLSVAS